MTRRLSGRVIDFSTKSPIGGARVTAEELSGVGEHHVMTGEQGLFWFEALPKNRIYEVWITKRGMTPESVVVFLSTDKDVGEVAISFTRTSDRPS